MKVGDKVTIEGGQTGEVLSITNILAPGREIYRVKVKDGIILNLWSSQVQPITPEPKGQCLTDATQALYTALVNLAQVAEKVERHLIVHPYQRGLTQAIYAAQEAINIAETGAEVRERADRAAKKPAAFGAGYQKGVNALNLSFPDPICATRTGCPNCHTNHEV